MRPLIIAAAFALPAAPAAAQTLIDPQTIDLQADLVPLAPPEPVFIDAPPPPPRPVRIANAPAAPTIEQMVPEATKAMIAAALESGNEGEVNTVVKYAAMTWPFYGQYIRQRADDWRNARARAREETIREAGMFDLWDGRGELGGFLTTGNTDNTGIYASVDIRREGLKIRHRIYGNVDYQQSFDITSRNRIVGGYEPNYKFDDRLYAYGALQYESDRFLGYDDRFSASAGLGYGLVREANLSVDVTAGPSFRQTEFTDDTSESFVGGRGSLGVQWRLSPGVKLTHNASAYLQPVNSTISSTSAIEAKLLGPLSARLSYALQYESDPPFPRESTDTTSRASLVYDF